MRTLICSAVLSLFLATTAYADITKPPPSEPVYEVSPGERPGYYLAPGYWRWNGKQHVWVPSRWIAERPGYSWVPDGWEPHGNKWHFTPGYWAADDEDASDTAEAPVRPDSTSKAAKRVKHSRKNYRNTRLWPKVVHH